ncbi:LCP family protein [Aeromicrobium terrae]|uniref:LytR family transcriptional regulator n=1 Tax=Aeromicrobium terrae TaxID=2498846 RepID=A0A5C8NKI4_9ACTN|nr:LCP family protein [Aeromicrobium terrae]TXL62279.1 LytR family transcriptional regulator [Aeromicrobium terrae]
MADRRHGRRYRGAGKRRAGGTPFHRRHRKLLIGLLSFVLVVVGAGAAYAYMLNSKFNNIDKVKTADLKDRPDPDKGRALNVMLLGSDKGKDIPGEPKNTTIADDAKRKVWPSGKYRSDTLMIVHISADRKHVYLVSLPRDTFTMLYNAKGEPEHQEKINGAFSYYGPNGTISTVEHLTDVRMRHMAIIDWAGFKDLSRAVGGVPVYIPRAFYDPKQKIQWNAGEQNLEGAKALAYVRTRYGLLRGDFDRIARQQNFLRSLMKKMLARGTMTNPIKLTKTLSALTENLTVDAEWDPRDMRALALSLRGTRADDVTFLTAPVAGTETVPTYGSIVRLDELKSKELFTAMKNDDMDAYVKKYPDDVLKSDKEIG